MDKKIKSYQPTSFSLKCLTDATERQPPVHTAQLFYPRQQTALPSQFSLNTTRMINKDKWYVTEDKTFFTISTNVQQLFLSCYKYIHYTKRRCVVNTCQHLLFSTPTSAIWCQQCDALTVQLCSSTQLQYEVAVSSVLTTGLYCQQKVQECTDKIRYLLPTFIVHYSQYECIAAILRQAKSRNVLSATLWQDCAVNTHSSIQQ